MPADCTLRNYLAGSDGDWRCVGIDPEGLELQQGRTALRLPFPQRVTGPGPLRAVLKQLADQARRKLSAGGIPPFVRRARNALSPSSLRMSQTALNRKWSGSETMRKTLFSILLSAAAIQDPTLAGEPITLRDMGSFHVGGTRRGNFRQAGKGGRVRRRRHSGQDRSERPLSGRADVRAVFPAAEPQGQISAADVARRRAYRRHL